MARKFRVEYPEAIYHVLNRGDRREPIFKDEADHQSRKCGIGTLAEVCANTGWQGQAVSAISLTLPHFACLTSSPQRSRSSNLCRQIVNITPSTPLTFRAASSQSRTFSGLAS